jgi:hypothetical protein
MRRSLEALLECQTWITYSSALRVMQIILALLLQAVVSVTCPTCSLSRSENTNKDTMKGEPLKKKKKKKIKIKSYIYAGVSIHGKKRKNKKKKDEKFNNNNDLIDFLPYILYTNTHIYMKQVG